MAPHAALGRDVRRMSRIDYAAPTPITLDPRRLFTPRQRAEIFLAAHGRCAKCGNKLGPDWQADHVLPWTLGGRTEISNGEALCRSPCHAEKSGADVGRNAKAKRQAKIMLPRPPSKIKSRPFAKGHRPLRNRSSFR